MSWMFVLLALIALLALMSLVVGVVLYFKSFHHYPLGKDEDKFLALTDGRDFPGIKDWILRGKESGVIKDDYRTTRDGLRVHAYYMECQGASKTVVLTHGYSGCAYQMMPYARMFKEELGCNVLLHDMPNHGKSEGRTTCFGWVEKGILLQWVERAKELFPETDLYLMGISMGGATSLMAAGDGLPKEVKGVVSDSAFVSVWSEVTHVVNQKLHLPAFPVVYITNMLTKMLLGWSMKEASTIEQVKKIDVPVLFIHGDIDTRVPVEHGKMLYDAKRGQKELWITEGVEHCRALVKYERQYVEKMRQFMNC